MWPNIDGHPNTYICQADDCPYMTRPGQNSINNNSDNSEIENVEELKIVKVEPLSQFDKFPQRSTVLPSKLAKSRMELLMQQSNQDSVTMRKWKKKIQSKN